MLKNAPEVGYNPTKKQWMLKRGENEVLFDALAMAIAFGDPLRFDFEDSALAVAGRRTENTVMIIYVATGPWSFVKRHSIDVKDRFVLRECYLTEKPERLTDELSAIEGLTWYDQRTVDGDFSSRKYFVTRTEKWPEFRNHDLRANLIFVDPELEKDLATAAVRLDELINDGKIIDWPGSWFGQVAMQDGEALKESLYDARLRAVLFAVEAVLPRKYEGSTGQKQPQPWYLG